ncbi:MaoC family dehydratase [Crassaminicella indica]|uniref:MaoC family dehydratase n=1 Tax=Crassaminicella indica TaxID=2855394 RepID=A0ABX8RA68_9CLOT|nr:MaoC family dehydratase [Crassaminicella indica]QXM05959.1 MaoC family dehydratase [Crassaminicella indica]
MSQFGRYYEEFTVGEVIKHDKTKTILESDNNLFSLLTMNHHPVHLDKEYCKGQRYKQILVVGTLVFSLVVGLTVSDISGKAIANLDYEKVTHNKPVFIGDTLHAETKILDKRESNSKNDCGIIYVETKAYNQKGEEVLTFRRHVLIPKRGLLK